MSVRLLSICLWIISTQNTTHREIKTGAKVFMTEVISMTIFSISVCTPIAYVIGRQQRRRNDACTLCICNRGCDYLAVCCISDSNRLLKFNAEISIGGYIFASLTLTTRNSDNNQENGCILCCVFRIDSFSSFCRYFVNLLLEWCRLTWVDT